MKTINLKRVVITGVGMVSPLGINTAQSWSRLQQGQSGIVSIKTLPQIKDNQQFPDIYMGLIPEEFEEKKWNVQYTNNRLNSYTMSAVHEAIEDAKIDFTDTTLQSQTVSQEKKQYKKGFKNINRMAMLHILSNMPTANVTIKYKVKGPSGTACTACATGSSAIGDSYRQIQLGKAKVMIAGGSEETLNVTAIHSAIRLQAMSVKKYNQPSQSSRPFDADRSGFILSEGSGVVILEELEHALKRNAPIYAEIEGYGCTSDGYHLTRPLETGNGGLKAMQKALEESLRPLDNINLINCHATSTPAGDHAEVYAINNLFGNDRNLLNNCLITANKSQIGHTFGASGAIESIFTILSIKHGEVSGILNLENPIKEPFINYSQRTQAKIIKSAIKNSFGFGGVNVSLVFSKYGN